MALDANAAFTDRHRLRTIEIPDPGAGNPALYVIPGNEVVQIVGVFLELSTDATVLDRRVRMFIGNLIGIEASVSAAVQPANLTWGYWFSCGIAPVDDGAAGLMVFDPLACGLQLYETETFSISAFSLQPGDVISKVYLRVYQWKQD